ncbi:helix-turn-helix domain-containing protein [Sporosarcina sp. 6E9]|uniref:helix-turn-helix domain-containing protein n=1 Tax=Sporosarcina sp. 6E9 TaxID=2819235 RepID=UPI001B30C373|nr:helix-turn-helix transcriptional regulator [Sporosarcina sp. 6E9]
MEIEMLQDREKVVNVKVAKAVEDFGGLIREFRLKNNLSLQDTANLVSCSSSYIWRIENYKRNPELNFRVRLLSLGMCWETKDVQSYIQMVIIKETLELQKN